MKRLLSNPKAAIYACGFFFSIQLAITTYANSSFLANFIQTTSVGVVYSVASAIGIAAILFLPRALARFGLRRFIPLLALASAILAFALAQLSNPYAIIACFIVWFITNSVIIVALDALLENFSDATSTGSTRGSYLGIINTAWLLSPFLSGKLLDGFGFSGIYSAGALVLIPVCIISMTRFKTFIDPIYPTISIRGSLGEILRNKNMRRIYTANFLLQSFYAVMVIYTPIYLHSILGYPWSTIGVIFTVMLLPFVLFEFPLGKLSDRLGERTILIAGFLIAASTTIMVGFIGTASVLLWALILFLTRVGACSIEVMTESYFFKAITGKDANLISVFRTLSPLAYIIVPSIASFFLLFISIQSLFVVAGAVMLIGVMLGLKLSDKR